MKGAGTGKRIIHMSLNAHMPNLGVACALQNGAINHYTAANASSYGYIHYMAQAFCLAY